MRLVREDPEIFPLYEQAFHFCTARPCQIASAVYMGMDLQPGLVSKQELDYLQTQMKNVYATQAEHADRLMRLEQRQEGESRLKSAWGTQSPFPGLLNGTPQQGIRGILVHPRQLMTIPLTQSRITILPRKRSRTSTKTNQVA